MSVNILYYSCNRAAVARDGYPVGGGFKLRNCVFNRIAYVRFAQHSQVIFVITRGNNGLYLVFKQLPKHTYTRALARAIWENFKPRIPAFVKFKYAAVFAFKPFAKLGTVIRGIKCDNGFIYSSVRNLSVVVI